MIEDISIDDAEESILVSDLIETVFVKEFLDKISLDDSAEEEFTIEDFEDSIIIEKIFNVPLAEVGKQKVYDLRGNFYYFGVSDIGTATSAAAWLIYRFDKTIYPRLREMADGDLLFDNIWDNHSILTYLEL